MVAETRLQERITGRYRATLTSVAGLGIELASLLVFAAWALGGAVAVALLVLAAVPVVASGLRADIVGSASACRGPAHRRVSSGCGGRTVSGGSSNCTSGPMASA